jgi:hypothetical protein
MVHNATIFFKFKTMPLYFFCIFFYIKNFDLLLYAPSKTNQNDNLSFLVLMAAVSQFYILRESI